MIPALGTLSIGQKVAGVALSLAIWLAPAGAVWLYMNGKISAAKELGRAECSASVASDMAAGWKTALEDLENTQGRLDKRAAADAEAIVAALDKAQDRADQLVKEFSDYANANPLPSGCRADPGRVRRVNEGRRPAE